MVHAICSPSERITTLDLHQGLVLLGLLIAQAYGQLGTAHQDKLLPMDIHFTDLPVQFFLQLLVNGQFDRLGSFLFGLSFYRCGQQARLDSPNKLVLNVHQIGQRLLIGLLGIGLTLSLLHRSVDLLAQYALLGFTLLYVRNQSVRSLLTGIVGLALLAILLPSCLALLHPDGVIPHGLFGWQPLREWVLPAYRLSGVLSITLSYELLLAGLLVGKLRLSPPDLRLRVRLSLLQVGGADGFSLKRGVGGHSTWPGDTASELRGVSACNPGTEWFFGSLGATRMGLSQMDGRQMRIPSSGQSISG